MQQQIGIWKVSFLSSKDGAEQAATLPQVSFYSLNSERVSLEWRLGDELFRWVNLLPQGLPD